MKKIISVFLFCQLLCSAPFVTVARAEEKPWTDQFLNEFAEIGTRIENIEKQQQEILAKDKEILERLDQLRIWVHRK